MLKSVVRQCALYMIVCLFLAAGSGRKGPLDPRTVTAGPLAVEGSTNFEIVSGTLRILNALFEDKEPVIRMYAEVHAADTESSAPLWINLEIASSVSALRTHPGPSSGMQDASIPFHLGKEEIVSLSQDGRSLLRTNPARGEVKVLALSQILASTDVVQNVSTDLQGKILGVIQEQEGFSVLQETEGGGARLFSYSSEDDVEVQGLSNLIPLADSRALVLEAGIRGGERLLRLCVLKLPSSEDGKIERFLMLDFSSIGWKSEELPQIAMASDEKTLYAVAECRHDECGATHAPLRVFKVVMPSDFKGSPFWGYVMVILVVLVGAGMLGASLIQRKRS